MPTTPYPSDVNASMVTHFTMPNGWAAKPNWARHEALIKKLYLYEKKSLAEVMRVMESQHGFKATSVINAVLFYFSAADVPQSQDVQNAHQAMGSGQEEQRV